jgi:hypothetical protein
MSKLRRLTHVLTAVALVAGANGALAAGGCAAFKWDVRHERALFATQPRDQQAGGTVASAPGIFLDRLYQLRLAPQDQVTFALPPGGRKPLRGGAQAGLLRLHIAAGGLYRISLSQRFWVDVVAAGKAVAPADFSGARGCSPHKILLYRLAPGDLLLQLSGWPSAQTELTVTRAPDRASGARH